LIGAAFAAAVGAVKVERRILADAVLRMSAAIG